MLQVPEPSQPLGINGLPQSASAPFPPKAPSTRLHLAHLHHLLTASLLIRPCSCSRGNTTPLPWPPLAGRSGLQEELDQGAALTTPTIEGMSFCTLRMGENICKQINGQRINLSEISISTSRPSFTQRPASYSAGHPMPNN